jgi:hypothetical protein
MSAFGVSLCVFTDVAVVVRYSALMLSWCCGVPNRQLTGSSKIPAYLSPSTP